MTKNCILYDCFNAIDDHYQTLICTLIDSRKSILVNSLSFNLLMRGFFANEAYYRYLFHHSSFPISHILYLHNISHFRKWIIHI